MGTIDCPELLVRNYHYLLCNNPEEHSSQELSCSVQDIVTARIILLLPDTFSLQIAWFYPHACQMTHGTIKN